MPPEGDSLSLHAALPISPGAAVMAPPVVMRVPAWSSPRSSSPLRAVKLPEPRVTAGENPDHDGPRVWMAPSLVRMPVPSSLYRLGEPDGVLRQSSRPSLT